MSTFSKKPPRLAIVGCGSVVECASILGLRRIGWLPSVLVDTSSRRIDVIAGKMGRKARVIKSSNWQSVAAEFDAALVALPHALHGSIGKALVEAGKHVFMEIPILLATTGREWQETIAAADARGVIFSVGSFRRYLQVARWTKALLQSKTLGDIEYFDVREGSTFHSRIFPDGPLPPDEFNGGVLTCIGAPILDLLLWWLGDVESVNYCDDSEGGPEANCVLECLLTSGTRGRVDFSRTRNLRNSIRIHGTQGFVEVHLHNNAVLSASPNVLAFRHDSIDPRKLKPQFVIELFVAELKDFKASITRGDQVGVSGREAKKLVDLIERCYTKRQQLILPWDAPTALPSDAPRPRLPPHSRILVTGATGFVGGRLVERLVREHDVKVRCTVRDFGHAARVGRLPVQLVHADLSTGGDVERAVDGVDYVFHCAYDTQSRHQNIAGLRNLIEACAKRPVRRLVEVSTFAVYEPFQDGPLTEESPDGDRSKTYVDTKIDLERMIFEATRDRRVAATIVQPAIVYGPFCWPWTITPAEMLLRGDVILPDQGEGLCNAVYVDDVVDALVLAAISPAAVGERFIISGPEPVTWATFFSEVARELGTQPPRYWPYEQIVNSKRGIVRNIPLAISDAKRLIKVISKWRRVRQVLRAALNLVPGSLRMPIMNYNSSQVRRRTGEVFLPNRQILALYTSKAIASSEKAHSKLGFRPRYQIHDGMILTGRYLQWVYEDIRETHATGRNAKQTPASVANA
ncbi:MAG: NAD-dependent epimerase/dehydratase family protein [Formivibrio sp.]|nr:NAD-dependent epimerase/dehydratase family protein [Formivibrio sp.]